MTESHSQQMNYLLLAIGALVIVMVVPILLSVFKNKKKSLSTQGDSSESSPVSSTHQADLPKASPVEGPAEVSVLKATVAETSFSTDKSGSSSDANLKSALKSTESHFLGRLKSVFSHSSDKKKVIEEVEEILYTSDLGPQTVQKLLTKVEETLSRSEIADVEKVKAALADEMRVILEDLHLKQKLFNHVNDLLPVQNDGPVVLMVVGVNGAGKTTSIGKMTAQLAQSGYKVLVAAGDTFRAAAGGQLKVWTDRAQTDQGHVEIFWPEQATDPAAVAYDAVAKAKAQKFDYVILDTAGRLHTQSHLMDELKKVKRVMAKVIPDAPHETWIVLDANSGQNALHQAVEFNKALDISGIILTKMDGTAKGGVVLGVVDQLNKPVRLVGLGEKIGDLKVFDYQDYIKAITGVELV